MLVKGATSIQGKLMIKEKSAIRRIFKKQQYGIPHILMNL